MTKVKICGINDAASFDTVVEAGADWVGFVFFPPSPRFITPAVAARLSKRHSGGPLRVGLFVKPRIQDIAATLDTIPLDILQVYADAQTVASIRAATGRPVWRAIGVSTAADLPAQTDDADAFVIEAKPPAGATRPGGNATAFDWALLRGWSAPAPWVLAGGLNPGNVRQAIVTSGATAVDVSSGVESAPGVKSATLIRDFIRAARRVD